MHHHIYHTHAFVIGSRNTGEANKMFTLYTRELGLVNATVQSIRLSKSKLRFSLQDLSYAKVDLVRGREMWRVTSATNINTFPLVRSNKSSLFLIARVGKLIERLCSGEESNEKIFDDFIQALYLLDVPSVEDHYREALELHLVLRLMDSLGYIGDSTMLSSYLESSFDTLKIDSLLKERQSIIAHINKALNESQL